MKKTVIIILAVLVCLCTVACKSSDYKKATEYQEQGEYESAAELFEQLENYEDSAERLVQCNNAISYKEAVDLLNSKQYDKAAILFSELNDYEDSKSKLDECNRMVTAIEKFNNAVEECKEKNEALDTAVSDAEAIAYSENLALDESLRPSLETAISNLKAVKVSIPDMPEIETEIMAVIDEISAVNYENEINEVSERQKDLEKSMKQYALVNAPEEAYIIQCLQAVEHIVDIAAVTEDNDPNGKLGKAGGYTAQVYFSSDLVDQSNVFGDSIIDKGTAGGGSIEVYTTVEDAEKRNSYLASFDGTFLSSGSHTVVGTVIVRTSDNLTASQQKELEANILNALTFVEE